LSDVNLEILVENFLRSRKLACFVSVKPRASFHMITVDGEGTVRSIEHITKSGARINGGFFVFRREIFQYIKEGEELVEQPFRRLISEGELLSYAHNDFWACMDTFKELQELEDLYSTGKAPWAVWNARQSR
jgi:glucose-1-phosphate cytidylyltransferase